MKKTLLTLIIASSCASNLVFANTQETETIVVTANRTPQNQSDLLSSVKVISRYDIELSSAKSVAELLNEVNGLQISQTGGAGQTTSLFTRGTNSGHTLVVIDGQRISSATLGSVSFADLATEQIERIEVIKGPRAALWGSDAIGGVIQIFTRQLEAGEVAIDLGLGNDGQQEATISSAIGHGDGSTTFTVSGKSSDGYDVYDLAESDDDGYSRENISIVGQQNLNQEWQVNWLAKYNQGLSEYDPSFGGANKNTFDTLQWQLSATQNTENWYQQLFIGQQKNESTTYGNGISEENGNTIETERLQGSWLASYQLTNELSSNFGIDLINEKVDSATNYVIDERDIHSVFARLAYDNDTIIIDGAVRYDDIENVDSEVTYSLSAGLRFAQDSLISLNIGSGFKAPSFNDLYYPNDGFSYGDPNLQAETSDSIELMVKSNFVGITTELSIYNTKIDNLIEWQPDQMFAYHPVNVNKAEINGIELTLAAQLLGLDHQLQLHYLDAKDDTTDEPLIRRAKRNASYQISQSWDKISLLASIHYQGEREDSEWPGTVTLPSHTIVNASAFYQLDEAWRLGIKINNLFDRDYVTNNHFIGQPAQYLLTVSYRN